MLKTHKAVMASDDDDIVQKNSMSARERQNRLLTKQAKAKRKDRTKRRK